MAGSFFTVGRDMQVFIQHPLLANSSKLDATLTGFDAKPNPVTIKGVGLDGKHREDHLPGNYTLTFSYDRGGSALDDFQSALDLAKRRSAAVPTGTIYQYINELDGSVSTYAFSEVTFQVTEIGNYKGDDKVTQTMMASAVERRRV
jgi:hypothetical protein